VRLEIVRLMTEQLAIEEKDRSCGAHQNPFAEEGHFQKATEEWDLLHRRYYSEEFEEVGIDLDRLDFFVARFRWRETGNIPRNKL